MNAKSSTVAVKSRRHTRRSARSPQSWRKKARWREEPLHRGIDAIPESWETVSTIRACRSLRRASALLKRLLVHMDPGTPMLRRDLRAIFTYVQHADRHIAGCFFRRDMERTVPRIWPQAAQAERMRRHEARGRAS